MARRRLTRTALKKDPIAPLETSAAEEKEKNEDALVPEEEKHEDDVEKSTPSAVNDEPTENLPQCSQQRRSRRNPSIFPPPEKAGKEDESSKDVDESAADTTDNSAGKTIKNRRSVVECKRLESWTDETSSVVGGEGSEEIGTVIATGRAGRTRTPVRSDSPQTTVGKKKVEVACHKLYVETKEVKQEELDQVTTGNTDNKDFGIGKILKEGITTDVKQVPCKGDDKKRKAKVAGLNGTPGITRKVVKVEVHRPSLDDEDNVSPDTEENSWSENLARKSIGKIFMGDEISDPINVKMEDNSIVSRVDESDVKMEDNSIASGLDSVNFMMKDNSIASGVDESEDVKMEDNSIVSGVDESGNVKIKDNPITDEDVTKCTNEKTIDIIVQVKEKEKDDAVLRETVLYDLMNKEKYDPFRVDEDDDNPSPVPVSEVTTTTVFDKEEEGVGKDVTHGKETDLEEKKNDLQVKKTTSKKKKTDLKEAKSDSNEKKIHPEEKTDLAGKETEPEEKKIDPEEKEAEPEEKKTDEEVCKTDLEEKETVQGENLVEELDYEEGSDGVSILDPNDLLILEDDDEYMTLFDEEERENFATLSRKGENKSVSNDKNDKKSSVKKEITNNKTDKGNRSQSSSRSRRRGDKHSRSKSPSRRGKSSRSSSRSPSRRRKSSRSSSLTSRQETTKKAPTSKSKESLTKTRSRRRPSPGKENRTTAIKGTIDGKRGGDEDQRKKKSHLDQAGGRTKPLSTYQSTKYPLIPTLPILREGIVIKQIVIIANSIYKGTLENFPNLPAKVIFRDNLDSETLIDIILKYREEFGKNTLWVPLTGIHTLVLKETVQSCKSCKTPLIYYKKCQNALTADCIVDVARAMCNKVQKELRSDDIIAVIPPIPSILTDRNSYKCHETLHKDAQLYDNAVITPPNCKVLEEVYEEFCVSWTKLSCKLLEPWVTSTAHFNKLKKVNRGSNLSLYSGKKEATGALENWYDAVGDFFSAMLGKKVTPQNSSDTKQTSAVVSDVRMQNSVVSVDEELQSQTESEPDERFEKVIVLGNTQFTRKLQKLTKGLPVIHLDENLSFDDEGLAFLKKEQLKYSDKVLWVVLSGVSEVATEVTDVSFRSKCQSVACDAPIPIYVTKNHQLGDPEYKKMDHTELVNSVGEQAFDFAATASQHLKEDSALFLAPIMPLRAVWYHAHSHDKLHKLYSQNPSVPHFSGKSKEWISCAGILEDKWLSKIEACLSLDSVPYNILKAYVRGKPQPLEYVDKVNYASIEKTTEVWTKFMGKMIKHYLEEPGHDISLKQKREDSKLPREDQVKPTTGGRDLTTYPTIPLGLTRPDASGDGHSRQSRAMNEAQKGEPMDLDDTLTAAPMDMHFSNTYVGVAPYPDFSHAGPPNNYFPGPVLVPGMVPMPGVGPLPVAGIGALPVAGMGPLSVAGMEPPSITGMGPSPPVTSYPWYPSFDMGWQDPNMMGQTAVLPQSAIPAGEATPGHIIQSAPKLVKGYLVVHDLETDLDLHQIRRILGAIGTLDNVTWPLDARKQHARFLMANYTVRKHAERAERILNYLKIFGEKSKVTLVGSTPRSGKLQLETEDLELILKVHDVMDKIKKEKTKKKKVQAEPSVGCQPYMSNLSGPELYQNTFPAAGQNFPHAATGFDIPFGIEQSGASKMGQINYTVTIRDYTDIVPLEVVNQLFTELGALEKGILLGGALHFTFQDLAVLKLLTRMRFPFKKMTIDIKGVDTELKLPAAARRQAKEMIEKPVSKFMNEVRKVLKAKIDEGVNVYTFKTRICRYGEGCHFKSLCHGFHNKGDRRRCPVLYKYSKTLCPEMDDCGSCQNNDKCSQAHSPLEVLFHSDNYRSTLCPGSKANGGACDKVGRVCSAAHPGKADMLYNRKWQHLYIEGCDKTLEYFAEAIKNLYMLVDLQCVRVLLITPSAELAKLYVDCVEDLAKACNQKVALYSANNVEKGISVLVTTTVNVRTLLTQTPGNSKNYDISRLKCLILDDGPPVIRNTPKNIRELFKTVTRGGVNIVITTQERLSNQDMTAAAEALFVPKSDFKRVYADSDKASESKLQGSNQGSYRDDLPGDREEGAKERKSHREDRAGTSSSSSLKERTSSSSSSHHKQSDRNRSKPRNERDSTERQSSIQDKLDKLKREYEKNKEDLETEHQRELDLYIQSPEVHPDYEQKYSLFIDQYRKEFPEMHDSGYSNTLWEAFWKELVTATLKEEYDKRNEEVHNEYVKKKEDISRQPLKRKVSPSEQDRGHREKSNRGRDSYHNKTGSDRSSYDSRKETGKDSYGSRKDSSQSNSEPREKYRRVEERTPQETPLSEGRSQEKGLWTSQPSLPLMANRPLHSPDGRQELTLKQMLRSLHEVCPALGILESALQLLLKMVSNCWPNEEDICKILDNEDNKLVLKRVSEKSFELSEVASGSNVSKFKTASIAAINLCKYPSMFLKKQKYFGLDLEHIARVSFNKDPVFILELIKEALKSKGVNYATDDEINDIFVNVSSLHFVIALDKPQTSSVAPQRPGEYKSKQDIYSQREVTNIAQVDSRRDSWNPLEEAQGKLRGQNVDSLHSSRNTWNYQSSVSSIRGNNVGVANNPAAVGFNKDHVSGPGYDAGRLHSVSYDAGRQKGVSYGSPQNKADFSTTGIPKSIDYGHQMSKVYDTTTTGIPKSIDYGHQSKVYDAGHQRGVNYAAGHQTGPVKKQGMANYGQVPSTGMMSQKEYSHPQSLDNSGWRSDPLDTFGSYNRQHSTQPSGQATTSLLKPSYLTGSTANRGSSNQWDHNTFVHNVMQGKYQANQRPKSPEKNGPGLLEFLSNL